MKRKSIILSIMMLTLFSLTGIGQAQKKFSLKLTGGYGTMSAGDINEMLSSLDTILTDLLSGFTKEGSLEKIKWGLDFDGELIVDLTDNIGIGLGVGYIQRKKDSETIFMEPLGTVTITGEPKITVIPIKLSAYYFYPIASRLNIFLNGGIGYYFGNITFGFGSDVSAIEETFWTKNVIEAKDDGIGFHGGIGFEYNMAKNFAFFVEGAGRYTKLKNWEGDITITDSDGYTDKSSGTVWYYETEFFGKYYPTIDVAKDKPTYPDIKNVRKFEGDLSGFSFRAGIRVKF